MIIHRLPPQAFSEIGSFFTVSDLKVVLRINKALQRAFLEGFVGHFQLSTKGWIDRVPVPISINSLFRLSLPLQNLPTLGDIKLYIWDVQEELIQRIKPLDLPIEKKPPGHMDFIFELVELDRRADVAETMEDPYDKSSELGEIVGRLVQIGSLRKSIEVMTRISVESLRRVALLEGFRRPDTEDNLRRFRQIVETISDPSIRGEACQTMSLVLMQRKWASQRAVEMAQLIPVEPLKSETLQSLVKTFTNRFQFNKAVEVAQLIKNDQVKWDCFIDIATERVSTDLDGALSIARLIPDQLPVKKKLFDRISGSLMKFLVAVVKAKDPIRYEEGLHEIDRLGQQGWGLNGYAEEEMRQLLEKGDLEGAFGFMSLMPGLLRENLFEKMSDFWVSRSQIEKEVEFLVSSHKIEDLPAHLVDYARCLGVEQIGRQLVCSNRAISGKVKSIFFLAFQAFSLPSDQRSSLFNVERLKQIESLNF